MSAGDGDAVIRVGTTFKTVDELVAKSATVVQDGAILVGDAALPAVGEQRRFQVRLADGTVALDGLGEVTAGQRLKIVDIAGSKLVYDRILAARRPVARRTAPPPFRKPDATPAPVKVEEVASPEIAAMLPAPEPTTAPVIEAPVIALAPVVEAPAIVPPHEHATVIVRTAWVPPPWLRTKRARIALAVVGAIFLIGIIAAIASDDDAEPGVPTAIAGAPRRDAGITPIDAGGGAVADAEAEAVSDEDAVEPDAGAEVDDEPAPPPEDKPASTKPKRKPSKPPAEKTKRAEKKPAAKKGMVRFTVKSNPTGASIRVDGEDLRGNEIMVKSGSVVKVTATKRGYKRVTKTFKVNKALSTTIQLQKM